MAKNYWGDQYGAFTQQSRAKRSPLHSQSFVSTNVGWAPGPPHLNAYTYTYKCGHHVMVTQQMLQSGGQVVPSVCPTCNPEKMPAAQMFKDTIHYWNEDKIYPRYETALTSSGPLGWLEDEVRLVRERAWA